MEQALFDELFNCLKILEKQILEFPHIGSQNRHHFKSPELINEKFDMLINRKGHLNIDNLTYLMRSKRHGLMVRLDMTGPPHVGLNGVDIDTPHVHIFDEEHYNGTQVEPLNKISDEEIINELHDSLVAFLLYNNVDIKNTTMPLT